MKRTISILRLLAVLIVAMILASCAKDRVITVESGGQRPTVITESPVSGKPTQGQEQAKQITLNGALLYECPVPLPPPPKTGKVRDASTIKGSETKTYYDCAFRHNALVKFLADKLGIVAEPGTEKQEVAVPPVKK